MVAWAWQWPHSDLRNAGAVFVGSGVLVVGLTTAAVAAAAPRWVVLVVLPSAVAAVFGVFVLYAVSAGQSAACGNELEACTSLLPGL